MTRGDVVLVHWLYSDRTGSKLRPAVVVQADYLNGLLDDTILVQITSKSHSIPGTEVRLDPSIEPSSGLRQVCYAFCPNVVTIDATLIDQVLGTLSPATMCQIDSRLKATLGLP